MVVTYQGCLAVCVLVLSTCTLISMGITGRGVVGAAGKAFLFRRDSRAPFSCSLFFLSGMHTYIQAARIMHTLRANIYMLLYTAAERRIRDVIRARAARCQLCLSVLIPV